MTGRLLLTSIQVDNIMPETHFLGQKKQGDTLYGVQVRTGQCHEGEGGVHKPRWGVSRCNRCK